jgi:TolB protein
VKKYFSFFVFTIAIFASPLFAQRRPVLPQIDLPHPYYYRELYLPQLTSGPSSVAWAPDAKEIVYSMAGTLWRQKLDSKEALQITDGPGYDYQPDWSPDGKNIIYVSYQKDAVELWLVNVLSGKATQLTSGGAVNVEPRWSPDGKEIIFVSTQFNKRFHIFRADVRDEKLENVVRLTGETKSELPRYYYSQYDTEINPVWTRDGQEILFVSNKGHIHGTGGFWRMKAEPGATAREIHYEETNWKARPDFSPDGSRMVYSSYLGGQWHNLWLMPANGGDAFPISYGDFDHTNVRWSPDGKLLASISNRPFNTEMVITEAQGGGERTLSTEKRKWLRPRLLVTISVGDEKGHNVPSRISVTDQKGMFYAPSYALIYADDGYDRNEKPFEAHYFYSLRGRDATVEVPEGNISIEISKGLRYQPQKRALEARTAAANTLEFFLKRIDREYGGKTSWISGDLHVHMNYGGTYRSERIQLLQHAEAEDLQVVNNLVVNKEQRFPDIHSQYFGEALKYLSSESEMVVGQEFHTSYWGHRAILRLRDHFLMPGYAGYPNTAAASLFPMNADVYDMAHEQGAVVGAVHPFDEEPNPFASATQQITDELPVDVALGKLDYMEIVGFSDHKSTAAVWYRLLNVGFHIPAGAGTDATTNYAAPIRGNAGFDRVYAQASTDGISGVNLDSWMDSLKNGRTFATNGPLIDFTMNGQMVGSELKLEKPEQQVRFTARLNSIIPVDHLEVVCNGRLVAELKLDVARVSADIRGAIPVKQSGWCVLRAWSEKAEYPVLDNYAYATTSPIYISVAGAKPRSPEDAKYFAAWIVRTIEITAAYPDWNSAQEKQLVLRRLNEAKQIYEKME